MSGRPGLHRELRAALHGQTALQRREHPLQLGGGEGGGGAAAHVEGTDCSAGLPEKGPGGLDLPLQSRHKGLHQGKAPLHGGGDEGAVDTPAGAEGDAHIEGDLVSPEGAPGGHALPGAVHDQPPADGGDPVNVPQEPFGPERGETLLHGLGGDFDGTHSGEGSPGGLFSQSPGARVVKSQL